MNQETMLKRFKKLKSKSKENIINFLKEESINIQQMIKNEDEEAKTEKADELLEFYFYFLDRGYLSRVEEYLDNDGLVLIRLAESLQEQQMEFLFDGMLETINNAAPDFLKKKAEELTDKIWNLNGIINLSFFGEEINEEEMIIKTGIMPEKREKEMLYISILSLFINDGLVTGVFDENNIVKYFAVSINNGAYENIASYIGTEEDEEVEYIKI